MAPKAENKLPTKINDVSIKIGQKVMVRDARDVMEGLYYESVVQELKACGVVIRYPGNTSRHSLERERGRPQPLSSSPFVLLWQDGKARTKQQSCSAGSRIEWCVWPCPQYRVAVNSTVLNFFPRCRAAEGKRSGLMREKEGGVSKA